jgi:hypothetical protein
MKPDHGLPHAVAELEDPAAVVVAVSEVAEDSNRLLNQWFFTE